MNLGPVTFYWNEHEIISKPEFEPGHNVYDYESENIGFIAQDVEKFFPQVVHEEYEEKFKHVEYGLIVSLGFATIIENQKRIDSILQRIKTLKENNGG